MNENNIYKLKDIKTFIDYERKLKMEMDKIKNDSKWIWFKLLNIPEKYKRYMYERLGIDKIYNIAISKKITIGKCYEEEIKENILEDKVLKIIEKYKNEFLDKSKKNKAYDIANYIREENINLINIESEYYVEDLKNIYDYPLMFFAKGNLKLLLEEKIAIVGARDCTLYGMNTTRIIAAKLVDKGYVIVSGLAKGIDRSAHIASSGRTIAILGTGLNEDVFYPKDNIQIYRSIIEKGGLVISEFLPDEGATRYNFPKRNRIIAGISNSVIISEAKKKSGSLITAEFAMNDGKDVYTVPGDILSKKYDGNNELLKDGAIPIMSLRDLDEYFKNKLNNKKAI